MNTNTETIMNDMQAVLMKIGINCEDDRIEKDTIFIRAKMENKTYLIDWLIRVDMQNSLVSMLISPDFKIPEDKVRQALEMVNQINKNASLDHIVYKSDLEKVFVITGIMITDDGLDKIEFEKAARTLLGNASFYLDVIKERISCSGNTEEIFGRMYRNFFASRKRK